MWRSTSASSICNCILAHSARPTKPVLTRRLCFMPDKLKAMVSFQGLEPCVTSSHTGFSVLLRHLTMLWLIFNERPETRTLISAWKAGVLPLDDGRRQHSVCFASPHCAAHDLGWPLYSTRGITYFCQYIDHNILTNGQPGNRTLFFCVQSRYFPVKLAAH